MNTIIKLQHCLIKIGFRDTTVAQIPISVNIGTLPQ